MTAFGALLERLTRHGVELFGTLCRCLALERLIEVKRAAGRPRDLEVIAELEALREERDGQGGDRASDQ